MIFTYDFCKGPWPIFQKINYTMTSALFFREYNDKVLTVMGNGKVVEIRPKTDSPNQKWRWKGHSLINIGNGQALDAFGGVEKDGNYIGTWSLHSGTNQQWMVDGGWVIQHESRKQPLSGLVSLL